MSRPFRDEFWTEDDHKVVAAAQNMQQLADCAIRKLALHQADHGGIIRQLCGPMSTGGLKDERKNFAIFEGCIRIARQKLNWNVFNQLPFQAAMGRLIKQELRDRGYGWSILHDFYAPVFRSGFIWGTVFLPTWQSSTGASWERQEITKIGGVRIEEFPSELYNDVLRAFGFSEHVLPECALQSV